MSIVCVIVISRSFHLLVRKDVKTGLSVCPKDCTTGFVQVKWNLDVTAGSRGSVNDAPTRL